MIVDTVSSYDSDLTCQWFSGSKLNRGVFAPETVESAPESDEKRIFLKSSLWRQLNRWQIGLLPTANFCRSTRSIY